MLGYCSVSLDALGSLTVLLLATASLYAPSAMYKLSPGWHACC